jgi:protein-disulfide isomerase
VRLVFRDFPLDNHAHAFKAAEAAQCAAVQGKFWPYHDKLFANQSSLEVDHLKRYAAELGLSTGEFTACLDQGRFTAGVREDLTQGMAEGVTATPTFFVNGRMLAGAQPFEAFKTLIDEELASVKK